MIRKALVALVIGAALAAPAGAAYAFEPPADPAGKFSCPGDNPVAGHPGTTGLSHSITIAPVPVAWNAVFNSEPVELCE